MKLNRGLEFSCYQGKSDLVFDHSLYFIWITQCTLWKNNVYPTMGEKSLYWAELPQMYLADKTISLLV